MDRGTWQATVHGVGELDTTERLSTAKYLESQLYLSIIYVKNLQNLGIQKKCRVF